MRHSLSFFSFSNRSFDRHLLTLVYFRAEIDYIAHRSFLTHTRTRTDVDNGKRTPNEGNGETFAF